MLINHMVEHNMNYAQDVDWKELVKMPKFAGCTKAYLQNLHKISRTHVKLMLPELRPEELTARMIQRYLQNSSKRRVLTRKKKMKEKNVEKLIQFYCTNIQQ